MLLIINVIDWLPRVKEKYAGLILHLVSCIIEAEQIEVFIQQSGCVDICKNLFFIILYLQCVYKFHIYSYSFILHGSIMNSEHDQLSFGLIAQLVEHCTSIAAVMGSNPVQA